MGTTYLDIAGNGAAATQSGSSDNSSADITLTVDASYGGSGTTIPVVVNTGSLAGLPVSGATQAAVYFGNATNSNQKIFWITAVDNVSSPKTITVSVAPTGLTAGSSTGSIGGRHLFTAANIESLWVTGDLIIVNTDLASMAGAFTMRNSGTNQTRIKVRGKAGAKRKITSSSTGGLILGSGNNWQWENIEFVHTPASGNAVGGAGASIFIDCKISDAGAVGFSGTGRNVYIGCEVSGCAAAAISTSGGIFVLGCYIHDNGGDGITVGSTNFPAIINNTIIDTCGGRGVQMTGGASSGAAMVAILNCTIYLCTKSGIESMIDDDWMVFVFNTIVRDCGLAAGTSGEFNVEMSATAVANMIHAANVFYHAAGSGFNLAGIALNDYPAAIGVEFSTAPGLTDPTNNDFTISSSGSAKGAGWPGQIPGSALSYPDIGAVQRQETAGGAVGASRARILSGY